MGHGKKNLQQQQPQPQAEQAEQQQQPESDSSSSAEGQLPDLPAPAPPGPVAPPKKKQYRVSHREIEDYNFTDEQIQILVDYIKDHPCLYDKKHRDYANNRTKLDLWMECATLFPNATYLQCRKYFEKKRTAFGKIENQEMKSGAAARPKTIREEEIMETWGFFKGHISHAATTSSQTFATDNESSSSDISGLSAASIERRRVPKKRRIGEASVPQANIEEPTPGTTTVISNLLERAASLTKAPWVGTEIEGFLTQVAHKLCRMDPDDSEELMFEIMDVIRKHKSKKSSSTALPQPPATASLPPPPSVAPPYVPPPSSMRPPTPGQWMMPRPMMPSPSGFTSFAVPPVAYTATPTMQTPTQFYAPQTYAYITSASTSTTTTAESPSRLFIQHLDSLPPLTPTMPPSTLNTPQGEEEEENEENK